MRWARAVVASALACFAGSARAQSTDDVAERGGGPSSSMAEVRVASSPEPRGVADEAGLSTVAVRALSSLEARGAAADAGPSTVEVRALASPEPHAAADTAHVSTVAAGLRSSPERRGAADDAGRSAASSEPRAEPDDGGLSAVAVGGVDSPTAARPEEDPGARSELAAGDAGLPPLDALARRGLVVLPSPDWTPELLEDLARGLDALPARVRAFPGGPLEVELHAEPTPFGLGDATHPALTDGLRRLHLYGYLDDVDDARAMARLTYLSADQRRRLWRRRAVVHAVIRRWDERLRWSARAGWRQLAGWQGDHALLVYPWAFSRRDGMTSPALDLATFAEELLVPAESLDRNAVPPDDRVRCRAPSKARFVDQRLTALEPSWRPRRDCPTFDDWADVAHVRGAEVLFAAPSAVSSQTLFGHLLLRVVREGDDAAAGAGQVMQLAALVSPLEPRASYLWRGLGGGFRGVFSVTTLADVRYEALGLQQREVRRFALDLSADQRERLVERMWELERVGYLEYRFFTANCATMLRFLLEPVLDDAAPGSPWTPWETPTQVLDALAPRLRPLPPDPPSGEIALRARASERQWLGAPPPGVREALGSSWDTVAAVDSASPAERAVAYRALAAPLPEALEGWRAHVAVAALRRERFVLDVATRERILAERGAILPGWQGPTTDELVARRQQRFETQASPRKRARAELAELLSLDELLRAAPRRALTASERAVVDAEAEARQAFEAAAEAVASLPQAELDRAVADERETQERLGAETVARAVPEGGHLHAFVGGGALSAGAGLLRVRAAALLEQLGDQRLGGLGSHVGVQVLDGFLELAFAPAPAVHRGGVTLLDVRTVGQHWGWGAGLDWTYAEGAHEVAASGEGLFALAADARLTNYLLATAGVRTGVRVTEGAGALVAPRAGLEARVQLPGSFANALRLDAAWTPRLLLGPGAPAFEQGLTGRVSLVVRLGVVRSVAVSARADGEVSWRPGAPLAVQGVLGVTLD